MKTRLKNLDLSRIREIAGQNESELEKIDALTPFYKRVLDSLSPQQAKIIVSMARHGEPARVNEITTFARLEQQNKTSAQLKRMIDIGVITRQDGQYSITDQYPYFKRYIEIRCGMPV